MFFLVPFRYNQLSNRLHNKLKSALQVSLFFVGLMYNINEKYVLMTADNVISNELFDNSHYFTWIHFKLHIYLEGSDEIFSKLLSDYLII
ncbi:hypothetical protein BpHYR1_047561 [Brachionus plicatilis]|uniref:Uncharacterized protein n=1 Tax=Brachionus plicatilis TaxID=10195 RepID=A0A3M7SRM8_BRAPC|nr:hypothetical protein BpHYR1_047561 [Brachionus plicatilis]